MKQHTISALRETIRKQRMIISDLELQLMEKRAEAPDIIALANILHSCEIRPSADLVRLRTRVIARLEELIPEPKPAVALVKPLKEHK